MNQNLTKQHLAQKKSSVLSGISQSDVGNWLKDKCILEVVYCGDLSANQISSGEKFSLIVYQKKMFNMNGGAVSIRDCLPVKIKINIAIATGKFMSSSPASHL